MQWLRHTCFHQRYILAIIANEKVRKLTLKDHKILRQRRYVPAHRSYVNINLVSIGSCSREDRQMFSRSFNQQKLAESLTC